MADDPGACRVCCTGQLADFATIGLKHYLRCDHCEATLLSGDQLPTLEEERARYLQHNNDPADPRYRAFVGRVMAPLCAAMPPPAVGLDYGCGPGPALAEMLSQAGYAMSIYDPIFADDRGVLKQCYDFITCTETVEHFHHPAREFARLNDLLRPGGVLAIMTNFQCDDRAFANWHYRRDPTHVAFYRESTMRTIAGRLGWSCAITAPNIVLMHKS